MLIGATPGIGLLQRAKWSRLLLAAAVALPLAAVSNIAIVRLSLGDPFPSAPPPDSAEYDRCVDEVSAALRREMGDDLFDQKAVALMSHSTVRQAMALRGDEFECGHALDAARLFAGIERSDDPVADTPTRDPLVAANSPRLPWR